MTTTYGRIRKPGPIEVDNTPTAFPTPSATKALWLADDCSSVGDGNAVTSWVDRYAGLIVGNTSTARPIYRATGLAGRRPSLEFDGSNDVMLLTASNPVSTSAFGTIIAVGNVTAPVSGGGTFWGSGDDASSTRYILGPVISGPNLVAQCDAGSGSADIMTGPITASVPAIYEWESIGAESLRNVVRLRQNNTLLTLTAQAGSNQGKWFSSATARDRFGIGALPYNNTINNFLTGHIAFLMVIDAELLAPERTAIYAWLSAYYGITVP